jgi:diguanylate cyclase (GGDEF)-like protein
MNTTRQPLLDALHAAHVRLGIVAVVAAGLVLALISFLTLRNYVEQNLTLVARSIAYSAEAATVFNDAAAANEVVAQIAAQEGLVSAAITRSNGSSWVHYARDRRAPADAPSADLVTVLFPLHAAAPVTYQGAVVGQVAVHGDGSVYLGFFLKVVAAVAGCMAVIAWWVSRLSRRIENEVVNPLNSLASLTRTARRERALGLRAPPAVVQEIHTLGEDFNALLAEIQARESDLLAKHDHLMSANESLSFLAFHDSLTGLPNRTSFLQHASRAVFASRGSVTKVAVLYIDSDNFKSVNDRLGHAAGDDVLIETARRIRSLLRESDVVARLGGDEFAVLLAPIRGAEDATRIAAEMSLALRRPVASARFGAIESSASIGVAVFPGHGATVDALMLAADAAMYSAKTRQPGSYRMYDPAIDGQTNSVPA